MSADADPDEIHDPETQVQARAAVMVLLFAPIASEKNAASSIAGEATFLEVSEDRSQ